MKFLPPLILLVFFPLAGFAAESSTSRSLQTAPNILALVIDDLGWGDMSLHHGLPHTPQLDRLATDGMELQRFYVYPVCSPTRAAFMTGMMPRRYGLANPLGPRQRGLPAGLPMLPKTLHAAGYQTYLVGKWHIGTDSPPLKSGFEHFYGFMGPQIDYFKHTSANGQVEWQRNGEIVDEPGYSTFLLADEAIRLLEKRDRAKPFFLELAFNAPHFPISAPQEYIDKYKDLSEHEAKYCGDVDALDATIGRLLAALDKQHLAENTLVVCFSDNGASNREGGSNRPFRGGKDTVYEGGIHTPCMMRWPGHLKAGANRQPIAVQDLYPTLLEAVGLPLKETAALDGKSQWAALRDNKPQARSPFIIATNDFAVIDGDWKLIETSGGQRSLYQLDKDPSERTDVLADHADIAERLAGQLADGKKVFKPALAGRLGPGGPGGGGGPPGRGPGPGGRRPPPPRQ